MKINSLSLFLLLCPKNKKYFYFLFFFVSNIVLSQTTLTFTKTGTGFWSVPCDVTSITVEAWGAGGAGGGTTTNNANGGGGGGGGAYVRSSIGVSPGTVINFSIGAGAAGATSTGASGGDTWFVNNTTILAKGGSGGAAPNGGNASGGATLLGSIGDNIIAGGNGGNGSSSVSGAGGTGGNSGGSGGAGGATNGNGGNGSDGFSPGGGGGGAFVGNNKSMSGGSGGNGQIRITYTSAYCYKNFTTEVEPITNVTFAGINNSTSATINGSYSNEYFCSTPANVIQGDSYNISLKGNTNGNFTDYFTVFIDWNQDGIFNNTGEKYDIGTITNSTGVDTKVLTGTILVPATALVGATKMKVVKNYNAYTDSCIDSQYGQAENYVVTVAAPPPCTPIGGTASLSPTSGLPSSTFTASVSGASIAPGFTYQWQWSYDNSTWNNLTTNTSDPTFCTNPTGATTTITAVSTFLTTVYYRRAITCTNSSSTSYSSSIAFITKCDNPTTSQPVKLYIEKFKYVGVLNDVPVENIQTSLTPYLNGYQDYTSLPIVAEQVQGSVVNVDVVCGGTITSPAPAKGRWLAWVDWNKDGVFSTSEEVYKMGGYRTESVTFGFIISPTRNPGDYKLRIAVIDDNSSTSINTCNLSMIGEVEDYLFRVIEDNQAKLDTSKQNVFSRCDPGIVPMTVYGKDANAVNFKWYDVKYGGTSLFTGSTYSPNITSTKTFYVTAVDTNGKETPFRYPIIARIDPVPEVTFTPTPETICGEDDPYLKLSVWGDKREEILIDEKFNSNLGVFSIGNEDSFIDSYNATKYVPDWRLAPSTPYLPPNPPHLAIKSSIASGYFGGNFAIVNTDVIRYVPIKRYIVSTSDYDINGFIKNTLKLDFDLYYFSNTANINNGYFSVEYSLDGTNWTSIAKYVKEKGNPLNWERISLDLHDLGVPETSPSKLKIRFLIYSNGTGTTYTNFEYFESIATVDNVKLYGFKPFERDFSWSGADAVVLYDKTCTTPLGNTLAREVCVKPPIDEFEKPYWDLYASATFQGGCSAFGFTRVYNDTKIWNQPGKTDWKQSDDWKPVGVPDIKKCVIARTPVVLPTGSTGTHGLARSVIVKSGGKLTIDPRSSLTIQNYLKNEAAASDVLVESDANLLQINNSSVNIGNITVKRNANLKRSDYTYWGSPVAGQNVKAFSAGTLDTRFYVYNESNDYFDGLFIRNLYPDNVTYSQTPTVDKNTHTFIKGKGYAIRASNTLTKVLSSIPHSFVGVPNNGLVDIPVVKSATGQGYNLISNPYPSNIDFYALYNYGTNSSIIYNTAYFWTNTNYNPKMQGANYPSDLPDGTNIINNYAILNGTGGVSAPYGSGTGNNDPIGSPTNCPTCTTPNEFIKVGQGFIVKVKDTGSYNLSLENNSGIRNNNSTSVFFNRMANNNQRTNVEKDRFWISLKTPLDFVSPILIGYPQGSTTNYEEDYDAELLIYGGDSFYSNLDNKKLAIQGRGYPFNPSDEVTLGARLGLEGQYEISLDAKEGVFVSQQSIFLYDKYLGVTTDISKEKYVFSSKAGDFGDRFVIQYSNQGTLNTSNNLDKLLKVYQSSEYIIIDSPDIVSSLKIYDVSGKLSFQAKPDKKRVEVHSSRFLSGVYILNIETKEGNVIKKITKK